MPRCIVIRPTRTSILVWLILSLPPTSSNGSKGHELSSSSSPPSLSSSDAASISAPEPSSVTGDPLQHSATIQHVLDQITKWQHAKYQQQQQQRLLLKVDVHHRKSLPFVTASFAQSLNGILAPYCEDAVDDEEEEEEEEHDLDMMIMDGTTTTTTTTATSTTDRIFTTSITPPARKKKKKTTSNYPLSGPSSLVLTHGIRSIHDGILIGGRTLSMDNPRLTSRLWTTGNTDVVQPIPIILDTHLTHVRRLGTNCRAAAAIAITAAAKDNSNNKENTMIVCCSHQAAMSWKESPIASLLQVVQILPCRCCMDDINDDQTNHFSSLHQLDLKDVLFKLYELHGIKSIMVEGGATVLNSFLEQNLIDCLCITIAPTILMSGSSLQPSLRNHLHLSLQTSAISAISAAAGAEQQQQPSSPTTTGQLEFFQLGSDCCFLCPLLSGWNVPTSQQ